MKAAKRPIVVPIPEPLRDRRDCVLLTTDQQIARLAISNADLVVMPPARRRSPAARISDVARRLFAGRPATGIDVLRVWALRAEPMV